MKRFQKKKELKLLRDGLKRTKKMKKTINKKKNLNKISKKDLDKFGTKYEYIMKILIGIFVLYEIPTLLSSYLPINMRAVGFTYAGLGLLMMVYNGVTYLRGKK